MININVQVTGFFRKAIGKAKFPFEIVTDHNEISIYKVLEQLCNIYGDPLKQLLYLDDGSLDNWSRIMINGKDINFLDKSEQVLSKDDHLLIMSVSAGG